MIATRVWFVSLLMLLVPLAASHVYNHEDKHEACEVYGPPHGHAVGDGHAHTHDPAVGAAMHDHDPCKQTRMDYPSYQNNAPLVPASPPLQPLPPGAILFDDGDPTNTEAYVGGEYYQFPIPSGQFIIDPDGMAVTSDAVAAGMGFPGDGSPSNPYIVEGYLILGGNMLFKDTSKCFVIRNNIIVNAPQVIVGPLLPNPNNVVQLPPLTPYWQTVKQEAEDLQYQYLDLSYRWEELNAMWLAEQAAMAAEDASWQTGVDAYAAEAQDWLAAFAAFEQAFLAAVADGEAVVASYRSWAADAGFKVAPPPTPRHQEHIDDGVRDMESAQAAFADYLGEAQGWLETNPPPPEAPPGYTREQWQSERETYRDHVLAMQAEADAYPDLLATEPDRLAYERFLDEQAAYLADYEAWRADVLAPFVAEHESFLAEYGAFQDEFDAVREKTDADIAAALAHFEKAAQYEYEYVGQYGTYLFDQMDQLVDWILQTVYGVVDPLVQFVDGTLHPNPNLVVQNNGKLILDWNGQCIHAYNNVASDLRVNQNNDRTGYATGGILEDNRFFVVGQIRHYDGIFRENEVGNRAHLYHVADESIVPAPGTPAQAMNNDGANQGWYYGNIIHGNVDLDFHGHHHSAGFFAPSSHYHGSSAHVAYMQTQSGTCTATHDNVNHMLANGPHHDYPQDNDIEVLGTTVLTGQDPEPCLPHQDHGKRWTSVFFNDNTVIDATGAGIRFEDRNHRADDEQANSENMKELKAPHFHQKWVQIEDNVVVGRIFVDVLNAEGTLLWNDDWSEVKNPEGPGRTAEALLHPGAEIVTSHPYRNDAWLDIQRNDVFVTQSTGIVVADAKELTGFQLKDNRGFALPTGYGTAGTPQAVLAWLQQAPSQPADTVWAGLQAWNGQDRGVQTLASLADLRGGYLVEHCGQVARGLDHGLVATHRVMSDGAVLACGVNDWGGASGVSLAYTPVGSDAPCTEQVRQATDDTDDFYATELGYDVVDALEQDALCQAL